MSQLNYGIFNDFWNDFPNHLPLLGLHIDDDEPKEWNLTKSLERLDFICDNNDEETIKNDIIKLLNDENWRPHLVAILASFKLSKKKQLGLIDIMWNRIEKGSWISPQILSVLSIIDIDFENKANEILNTGFIIKFSKMNMIEHHSSRGSESSKEASQKVIENIKSLLQDNDDEYGWKDSLIYLIQTKKFKLKAKKKP